MINIKGGTVRFSGASLCVTCKHSHVVKGEREEQQLVKCDAMCRFVPFRVVECSEHMEKTRLSLYEMEKMAWVLDIKRNAGFVKAEDFRKREGNDDSLIPPGALPFID